MREYHLYNFFGSEERRLDSLTRSITSNVPKPFNLETREVHFEIGSFRATSFAGTVRKSSGEREDRHERE